MLETLTLRVDPKTAATDTILRRKCAQTLEIEPTRIKQVDITRRSIDARQKHVMVNLTVNVHVDTVHPEALQGLHIEYPDVSNAPQAIIVGAGPAGLFAALELIELGIKPIVLERGKDVDSRRADMVAINRNGTVNLIRTTASEKVAQAHIPTANYIHAARNAAL